jgi:hypothetical protein
VNKASYSLALDVRFLELMNLVDFVLWAPSAGNSSNRDPHPVGHDLCNPALVLRISTMADWLFVLYLAWVSFATILSFEIWRLNS